MRMSDWSSDVCSSDLAQGFDAFDAKTEALALLSAAGAPVDNLQVFGEAGAAWHPGQSGTLRLGPKTVLAAFGMVHPATLKAFDLDGPVAAVELYLDAVPGKRSASRSEEHTSELQSLMRISYAVFCLKKKKTHEQTNDK